MSNIADLIRPEIRNLRPYRSATFETGLVRLNANETPWRPVGDVTVAGLNRYPEPRPFTLTMKLAALYGVTSTQLLVTRGSSEAIDLLIRGFCRAGQDDIVICPPTFGMYEFYAQVQGAGVRPVPLLRDRGYMLDVDRLGEACDGRTRLLFVCSPNNPTGNRFADSDIDRLADMARERCVVVVDGAYSEFADADATSGLLERHDNVVVLRTLSKAMGLAGARCGVLIGPETLVELLGRALPPYCFPTLSVEAVERCLLTENRAEFVRRNAVLKAERTRLVAAFSRMSAVTRVWPSEANFLLLEVRDPRQMVASARAGGVLVRDFSWDPWLPGCLRVTVGGPEENDQLLRAWGAA
jgi:histidinol-phosphate aminotransferase